MKRTTVGVCLSLALATAMIAAQSQNPPPMPQQKAAPDVTLTGCLTQGTGPTVFLLENARRNAADRSERGMSYMLVEAGEDLALRTHINHEVSVTGTADAKVQAPPPGQKPSEKDLPKFSVKTVTDVADRCTAVDR